MALNEDYQSQYASSIQIYLDARRDTDAHLQAAQVPGPDDTDRLTKEFADLKSVEDRARDNWIATRDTYFE